MKYNPAEAYALAIGHLADRLRGGGPFVQPGRATSACSRAPSGWNCSSLLAHHGYDVGEPDGHFGARRPAPPSANSRPKSAGFPTVSPRRAAGPAARALTLEFATPTFELTFLARYWPIGSDTSDAWAALGDLTCLARFGFHVGSSARSSRPLSTAPRVGCVEGSLTSPAQAQLWGDRFPFLSGSVRSGRQRPLRRRLVSARSFGATTQRPSEQRVPQQSSGRQFACAAAAQGRFKTRTGRADDFRSSCWATAWPIGWPTDWKTHLPIRRKSASCARTSSIPACCATNKKAISTGGMSRATSLPRKKPNYVVMMLGVSDRQSIRERDLRQGSRQEKEATRIRPPRPADKDAQNKDQNSKIESDEQDQQIKSIAPEQPAGTKAERRHRIPHRAVGGDLFKAYRRDDCGAQEQGRAGVLGRPAVDPRPQIDRRCGLSQRSLPRARRAAPASVYIDVWDGFVDEGGKYTNFGPDYEGQMRRLRSNDGVFFTKYGARKLAHYVEREIRRYMTSRVAGGAAVRAGGAGRARLASRRRGRWPGPWCR